MALETKKPPNSTQVPALTKPGDTGQLIQPLSRMRVTYHPADLRIP